MNIKSKLSAVLTAALLAPGIIFAATNKATLADVIDLIVYYLNVILVLMMGVAVVVFVYFVIKYFILPNENRKDAGLYVMYSVIGFFVILSFWGIVNILQNTFGLQNERNRPDSWVSFTNLFPRSGGGGGFGTFNQTQNGYGTFNQPQSGYGTFNQSDNTGSSPTTNTPAGGIVRPRDNVSPPAP